MDGVVHNTAAIAEESAASSEQMNAQAEKMRDVVASLVAMAHGNPKKI